MSSAMWKNTTTTTGKPYNLSAHPLYYSPVYGKYVTSADNLASTGSVDFSSLKFGRRTRRTKKRSKRSKRSKHSRRRRSKK